MTRTLDATASTATDLVIVRSSSACLLRNVDRRALVNAASGIDDPCVVMDECRGRRAANAGERAGDQRDWVVYLQLV